MAIISQFYRDKEVPEADVDGNLVTATETWHLILDSVASPIAARALIGALVSGNGFGWMVVGVDSHPDGWRVVRLVHQTRHVVP